MRRRTAAVALLTVALAACHRVPLTAEDPFDQTEKRVFGQHSLIVESAVRALSEAKMQTERQFITYDGGTVIVAHPVDAPSSVGSVVVQLKEVGSDETSVSVKVRRSLSPTTTDGSALASKILGSIGDPQKD